MYELYTPYSPTTKSAQLLVAARDVITAYQADHIMLTLRQLYYQLVTANTIPNTEKSYKKLGKLISSGRLGGLLDWDAIEDRMRSPEVPQAFNSVGDLLEVALRAYRLPRMKGQDVYVELWVEKDALASVLTPIARRRHVTLMVNRGYSSSSAMRESAERIRRACDELSVRDAAILYLGDLDPSGEDMVRDIRDRTEMFLNAGLEVSYTEGGTLDDIEDPEDARDRKPHIDLTVEKLGLTIEQVHKYRPPPNPTKVSDSRAKGYIEKYGHSSWEVDALPPKVLQVLIDGALDQLIDMDKYREVLAQEERDKEILRGAVRKMKDDQEEWNNLELDDDED